MIILSQNSNPVPWSPRKRGNYMKEGVKVVQGFGRRRCQWNYPFSHSESTNNSLGNREQKFSQKLHLPGNSPRRYQKFQNTSPDVLRVDNYGGYSPFNLSPIHSLLFLTRLCPKQLTSKDSITLALCFSFGLADGKHQQEASGQDERESPGISYPGCPSFHPGALEVATVATDQARLRDSSSPHHPVAVFFLLYSSRPEGAASHCWSPWEPCFLAGPVLYHILT